MLKQILLRLLKVVNCNAAAQEKLSTYASQNTCSEQMFRHALQTVAQQFGLGYNFAQLDSCMEHVATNLREKLIEPITI